MESFLRFIIDNIINIIWFILIILDIILNIIIIIYNLFVWLPYKIENNIFCRKNKKIKKKKVIIVGYSFAGYEIHHLLQQKINHFEFIIIEPKMYFEFVPSLIKTVVDPEYYKIISLPMQNVFYPKKYVKILCYVTNILYRKF